MRVHPGPLPLLLVMLGCGGDAVGPPGGTGLYQLVSVAGQPLPFVLPPSASGFLP